MSGDQRRDRLKHEIRSRGSSPQRESTPGDVIGGSLGDRARAGESEPPTRPRGRTISDSESPAEPRVSVSTPAFRAAQDSFHPVRVPPRTVRPPMSLWARTWGTVALVIIVGGGAIGIVSSLRARKLVAARDAQVDGWLAAPSSVVPLPVATRSAASPSEVVQAAPLESSTGELAARPSPSAVVFRTTDSLAVSPPVVASSAPPLPRRSKPQVETATAPPTEAQALSEQPANPPTPEPTTSDPPETKEESEVWVTEERRF